VAEWLGSALQKLLLQFEPGRDLPIKPLILIYKGFFVPKALGIKFSYTVITALLELTKRILYYLNCDFY
jgi:hypothetical protein